jgi:alpha-beta hydrolase superfamily lysophospholipase
VTRALLAALVVAIAATSAHAADDEIRTISSRPGVTQAFLLVRPPAAPVASVVLFAGGRGRVGLERGRPGPRGTNFLVRNRARFAERGLLVALLDVPSDRAAEALVGFRTSAEHADDVRAMIAALRAEAPVAVWLIGTSMGSVSAANAAARLTAGGPDGVVLTSSVMGQSREMGESLQQVALDTIRVPTLVVHHRDDACRASRYADTSWLLRRLSAAPKRERLTFTGGHPPESDPCEPLAPHGYFGIDGRVVDAIVEWITATSSRAKP